MEEEKQTISKQITEEKSPAAALRVKNPKRVAQGKKLAEISRAAKARKRAEQQNEQPSENIQLPNLTTTISLVGVLTGVIGTYIAWKNFKQEEVKDHSPPVLSKSETKYNNLDDEDI